ncbi:MAG: colanic acid biosynthesis glycosyltransferase WcaL [Rhodobacteraceae bacterium CG17_big_fil_post_rev_8_21_14_2_50_65_11]|nr:MAG: colanic acid biosynthesis glycosyltransferase WcaL [Rhodobacteraceae bacterium CG17_big_fil_post_rev_8_21_14_2_50_65_11]
MKIAYLTGEYPRATDTFIQREVAGLRDLGLTVETCTIRRTGAAHLVGEEQRQAAAETFAVLPATLNALRLTRAKLAALRYPGRFFRALALAWRTAPKGIKGRAYNLIYFAEALVLADHMRRTRVTHLHNHIAKASCTVAMLASALSGIPYSFTLHGPDIFFAPEHWRLDEKIARARFVACISDFCRAQAMLWSAPAHWGKLKIVHCGVEPARYTAGDRDGTRLVFVGRLASVKGIAVLLEAFVDVLAARPDLTLTLVGDGPERAALEAEAARLGVAGTVRFAGYQSQAEVADLLASHDALVLPSFAEGVPVVLMEALAAGLPVIATAVGGVGELVKDGETGCLIAPGDAAALCDAILRMFGDAAMRARMGAAGRARIEAGFTARDEAARLATLFQAGADLPQAKRPEAAT